MRNADTSREASYRTLGRTGRMTTAGFLRHAATAHSSEQEIDNLCHILDLVIDATARAEAVIDSTLAHVAASEKRIARAERMAFNRRSGWRVDRWTKGSE